MSKKNKKAKKALRQQAMKQVKKQQQIVQAEQGPEENAQIQVESEEIGETKEARSHIKKILITMAVLVLIIVGIYLINLKSDFILKLGDWLSKSLNIQV
jgi:predicted nucleic acid-binding Zn ribbon protein